MDLFVSTTRGLTSYCEYQRMSQIDSQLIQLRARIVALEEEKRVETETALEKKASPLKALETQIVDRNQCVARGCGKLGSSQRESYTNSRRELIFLEPILDALKDIQERLDLLEKRDRF
jgi:hypothetical protein